MAEAWLPGLPRRTLGTVRRLVAGCILATSLGFHGVAGATTTRWFQPIMLLPKAVIHTTRCILYAESRSTFTNPNLGDTNPYQFGPFQFTPVLWNRWAWVAGVGSKTASWYLGSTALNAVTIPAYRASLRQQAKVFAVVARYDGTWPWTAYDRC